MADNAELLFDQLQSLTFTAFERWLLDKRPEDLFMDYKGKTNPDGNALLSDSDKRNYAKALSGFANSAGGVLVWGVDKNWSPKPITAPQSFVQRLEELLPDAVAPVPDTIVNHVILREDHTGYVLTFVLQSDKTPHRAEFREHHYYKRVGSNFLIMEHYEIEDMFGRRARPFLTVSANFNGKDSSTTETKYELALTIANEGKSLARSYGWDLEFPRLPERPTASQPINARLQTHRLNDDFVLLKYRNAANDPPLFPGECVPLFPNNHLGGHFYYVMNSEARRRGFKEGLSLKCTVYADGAPPHFQQIPWSSLQDF